MYFNKYPFSHNFDFSHEFKDGYGFRFENGERPASVSQYAPDIFRITVKGGSWECNYSQVEYAEASDAYGASRYHFSVSENGCIELRGGDGEVLLKPYEGGCFGKCGDAAMFRFEHSEDYRYYGAGSKLLPLEHSGMRTKFWNTDAWADFPKIHVFNENPDPYYVSIPYLIIKTPHGWVGLLYNNPQATFISIGSSQTMSSYQRLEVDELYSINIGSESGQPDLFVLAAESLAELTRNLQCLVGTTPLPPMWALGYQQCRWGYDSVQQLEGIRDQFAEHEIPVDGMWLDIDYMDGFRVFTFDESKTGNPEKELKAMLASGHPVVPIIDPGVKCDPEYSVYQSGKQAGAYCKNPEGLDFIGLVWPGLTAFPDFSRKEVREWWAKQVQEFASLGIVGAWIDMNDPSVGRVNPYDMRWGVEGELPHEVFHNQYGVAMARATRMGFERAHPDKRIFLLTRSNFIGGGKYAAVWTGDNLSSYHYLKMSLPTSLNLALSGIPFNGADIGGFGQDTTPALLRDWTKAACLGAFCRNHTELTTISQEPWAFDELTLSVCRAFIVLRYALMPYLYNLFVAQEESGEAILRPLIYDFDSTDQLDLDRVDDAFLVGPSILQAPFVDEESSTREVPLPGYGEWYSLFEACWYSGDRFLAGVVREDQTSPIFLREGAIIPLRRDAFSSNITNLSEVDFLVVASRNTRGSFVYEYTSDDGSSLEYKDGKRSRVRVYVDFNDSGCSVKLDWLMDGYGPINVNVCFLEQFICRHQEKVIDLQRVELPLGPIELPVFKYKVRTGN